MFIVSKKSPQTRCCISIKWQVVRCKRQRENRLKKTFQRRCCNFCFLTPGGDNVEARCKYLMFICYLLLITPMIRIVCLIATAAVINVPLSIPHFDFKLQHEQNPCGTIKRHQDDAVTDQSSFHTLVEAPVSSSASLNCGCHLCLAAKYQRDI